MNIVSRTVTIERPCDLVQAQFADIVHHERSAPHRNVSFALLAESSTACDYSQISRQGPLLIKQQFHLDRSNLHHQRNTVTAGAFRGAAINFDIEASTANANATTVTATIASERAIHRILRPILRMLLSGPLGKALVEDKRDLESGSYPGGSQR